MFKLALSSVFIELSRRKANTFLWHPLAIDARRHRLWAKIINKKQSRSRCYIKRNKTLRGRIALSARRVKLLPTRESLAGDVVSRSDLTDWLTEKFLWSSAKKRAASSQRPSSVWTLLARRASTSTAQAHCFIAPWLRKQASRHTYANRQWILPLLLRIVGASALAAQRNRLRSHAITDHL